MKHILALILSTCVIVAVAGDKWTTITADKNPGLLGNEIQFIEVGEGNKVWIGTMKGLSLYEKGKLTAFKKGGEAYDIVRVDADTYLVGTSNGLVQVVGGKPRKPVLGGHRVVPICPRGKGKYWVLAKHGRSEINKIFEYDGKEAKEVEALKDKRITSMFQDSTGAVWITIDGNGVLEIKAGKKAADAKVHLKAKQVSTMFEDSRKRIWCGLWGPGVMVKDGDEWDWHIKKERALKFAVDEDTNGNIWVATNENGAWSYDGKTWKNHLKDEGPVNMLATTSDGKVWVSTQASGGLSCYDGKTWQRSIDSPLPIRCLVETRDKTLIAGGVLDGIHVKK